MPSFSPPFVISMLLALSIHEWAHAFAADRLGDRTARMEGRLTINPIAHLDPIGTLLFLVVGFGWGKPVPFNERNLRHPVRDSAIIAIAGPLSNVILAFFSLLLLVLFFPDVVRTGGISPITDNLHILSRMIVFFQHILLTSLFVNLGIMAFNLLPVAPLDGSKIITYILPCPLAERYRETFQYGPFILLGILVLERMMNIPLLSLWVSTIADGVFHVLFRLLSVVS